MDLEEYLEEGEEEPLENGEFFEIQENIDNWYSNKGFQEIDKIFYGMDDSKTEEEAYEEFLRKRKSKK